MDIKEELDEIISGAAVSSYSIINSQILNMFIASLIIGIIGASSYGVIGSIRRASQVLGTLLGGVSSGLNRTLPRLEVNEKNTVVISAILYSVIQSVILLSIIFHFQDLVIKYTFINEDQGNIIEVGLYLIFFTNLLRLIMEILKSYKKIPEANLTQKWIFPITQIITVYIISLFVSSTVISVLYSLIIASIITILAGLYLIKKRTAFLSGEISKNISPVVGFISFVLFVSFSGIFSTIQYSTPNILMFSIPEEQAGAFSIALIITSITRIPLNSINQIYPQVATELYEKGDTRKINSLFKSTSKIATFFCIPMFIISSVYHNEIAYLFAEEYVKYSIIIPSILVGQVVAVTIGTVGLLILMTDNERTNIILQIIISIISLSVLVPLTIEYGIYGLAIGFGFTLTINNIIELLFLYYNEGLWSITKDHIGMVLSAVLYISILITIKIYTPLYLNLIISVLFVIMTIYINYKYFLKEDEEDAIQNYKAQFIKGIMDKTEDFKIYLKY